MEMTLEEMDWFIDRAVEQIEQTADELEKAQAKAKGK